MGVFGGFLGIGGSVVMIPAMVFVFGENQHLYQASAMICNFFVAGSSVLVHKKQQAIVFDVVKWLIPSAAVGILIGVAVSNSWMFARERSYLLARLFGAFLVYVVIYNLSKLRSHDGGDDGMELSGCRKSIRLTILSGLLTGILAGLFGMGGGTICIPAQQIFLKMPLKRAISNSAATIASVALIGAFYKNATLGDHGIELMDSIRIAAVVFPTAIIGGLLGGRLMHKLPKDFVRVVFVILVITASIKLLLVKGAS